MIKVTISKSWTGRYYVIEANVDYEAFEKLGNSNITKEQMDYGKSVYGFAYCEDDAMYPNDVSGTSYCYKSKEARWTASTIDDVNNWLNKNRHQVTI